jgi:CrcB protein
MTALYVIVGAAIGAPSRFLLDQYLRNLLKYPLGITVINALGSFVLGLSFGSGVSIQALVGIGFAGAFTTWSTFMLDVYLAFELKQHKAAATNLVLSLALGLAAVWLGIHLAQ